MPNPGNGSVTVSVEPGERVTCTFENAQHGELIVAKSALGGDDTFSFTSATLGDFDLLTSSGVAQQSFPGLKSGLYDVGENALAGWDLTDVTCDDGSEPDAIDLQPGETVTCTFENSKRGEIVVVKNAIGGDDDFEFYSDKLGGFTLTTMRWHRLHDIHRPDPWPVCGGRKRSARGLGFHRCHLRRRQHTKAITLDPGETVTCTFENTKRGQIDVVKAEPRRRRHV